MIKNYIMRTILHYLFRVFYFFILCLYKPLKFLLRPIIRLHPRLYNFAATLREGLNELIRVPELTLNTSSEITSEIDTNNKIPGWLIDEWKAIHEIEPQLFPGKWLVDNIPFYSIPNSRIGDHYLELCRLYGNNVSHVFLVPWIDRGGADIVTLNHIRALINHNLSNYITVISTFNTDSPWAYKLPDKVRFIEFGKKYSHLSEDEQEKLLTRLLIQMAPKVIHNINSDLGYKIFVKYGNALNSVSNLYASFFCTDITQKGEHVGYAYCYLPKCFDCLKAVAIDNQSFLNRLIETYAFDKEKMYVHYQPIQITNKRKCSDNIVEKKQMDIIWAGRMDRQKRPDILMKIAQASQDLPFRFHVYGISVLDDDIFTDELTKQKNITCYGVFNKLDSLPIEQFDLFLYTSQWDGMPTILLDAISLGLPIIASDVGGISELIIHDKTGFLINPYDDIDCYVNCLKKIYNNRALLTNIVNNAYELISKRHSWECFLENLNNFPGYINT
ncbi:MAG: glycosyltransferase family 4 protein [Deltaproteobacteria bacterium]|nr:glycosyltransferase family 4 protein [Deltaproteobacteria bacterium]